MKQQAFFRIRTLAVAALLSLVPAGVTAQGFSLDFGLTVGTGLYDGVRLGLGFASGPAYGYAGVAAGHWDPAPAYDFRGGYHGWKGTRYTFIDYSRRYAPAHGVYGAVHPRCAAYHDPWAWDVWGYASGWRSAWFYDCIVAGPTYAHRGVRTARYFARSFAFRPWHVRVWRSPVLEVWAGTFVHRRDPFWPTWGPYWAHDPWPRWNRGWGGYVPTTVVVANGYRGRTASPWAWGTNGPVYKEPPGVVRSAGDRGYAVPRSGTAALQTPALRPASATAVPRSTPGVRAPGVTPVRGTSATTPPGARPSQGTARR